MHPEHNILREEEKENMEAKDYNNSNVTWEVWSKKLAEIFQIRTGMEATEDYLLSFRDCYDAGDDPVSVCAEEIENSDYE